MYSRLGGWVKSGGATGSSLAVPGTPAREAVADCVFCAMPRRKVLDVARPGKVQRTIPSECTALTWVLALLFRPQNALPPPTPGPSTPPRRLARERVRRSLPLHLRPDPPPRPLGPSPRRPFPAGVGDRQAHQHRNLTGLESDRPRRSRPVLLPVRGPLIRFGFSRARRKRDRRIAAVLELRRLPPHRRRHRHPRRSLRARSEEH